MVAVVTDSQQNQFSFTLDLKAGATKSHEYLLGVVSGHRLEFDEAPVQCIDMALAQGADLVEWCEPVISDADPKPQSAQSNWAGLKKDMRNGKVS